MCASQRPTEGADSDKRPDYMHEMLTNCSHSPLCHNSWDPCLLEIQHPHAIGATGEFAGPYSDCPKCEVCSMCKGSGVMMGGDEYQPCPRCGGHDVVPESATFDGWMAWAGMQR